jgi:hypothetical protein
MVESFWHSWQSHTVAVIAGHRKTVVPHSIVRPYNRRSIKIFVLYKFDKNEKV